MTWSHKDGAMRNRINPAVNIRRRLKLSSDKTKIGEINQICLERSWCSCKLTSQIEPDAVVLLGEHSNARFVKRGYGNGFLLPGQEREPRFLEYFVQVLNMSRILPHINDEILSLYVEVDLDWYTSMNKQAFNWKNILDSVHFVKFDCKSTICLPWRISISSMGT